MCYYTYSDDQNFNTQNDLVLSYDEVSGDLRPEGEVNCKR